jgi:hypothetical protein
MAPPHRGRPFANRMFYATSMKGNDMKTPIARIFGTALVAVGLIGAAGCSKQEQAQVDTKIDQAQAEMENRIDGVGESLDARIDAAGDKLDQAQAGMSQAMDDTAITAKVKARFAESPAVSALAVGVETTNGVVTLTGTVENESARMAAESIARSVSEVQDVQNGIVVES